MKVKFTYAATTNDVRKLLQVTGVKNSDLAKVLGYTVDHVKRLTRGDDKVSIKKSDIAKAHRYIVSKGVMIDLPSFASIWPGRVRES